MNLCHYAAIAAATLALASLSRGQNCSDAYTQCWSFAPRGDEVERMETGLSLRSKQLTITGDLRLRIRGANAPADAPYQEADQQATRARIQMNYQATEKVRAKVEFLFAETWAGSESYSDALGGINGAPNEQYNKVSQAYAAGKDLFGLGEEIRVGRSDFFLSNGFISAPATSCSSRRPSPAPGSAARSARSTSKASCSTTTARCRTVRCATARALAAAGRSGTSARTSR